MELRDDGRGVAPGRSNRTDVWKDLGLGQNQMGLHPSMEDVMHMYTGPPPEK